MTPPRPNGHQLVHAMQSDVSSASSDQDIGRKLEELERELSEAHLRETATAEILGVISRSKANVQPVFDTIVRSALRLCDGLFSSLFQFDGNLIQPVAHHNYTPEALEQLHRAYPRSPDRGGGTGRAILDRAIVQIRDVELDPEYEQHVLSRAIGWRSGLFVPMLRDGVAIGVIMVARTAPGPFSDNEVQLLKSFADQAVIAIENTRLFESEQASKRELQESLDYQTAVSEVLGVISRSPSDLQHVVDTIVRIAKRLCSADRAAIWRLRDGKFQLLAHMLPDPALAKYITDNPLPAGLHSLAGRAVAQGRTLHVSDVQVIPELGSKDQALAADVRTVLHVPLLREKEPIGVLTLLKTKVQPFSQEQIELVETFADQAVIAMENARLFEEVHARTRELQESLEYQNRNERGPRRH